MEIQLVSNNKEMKNMVSNITHDMKTVNMLCDFNNLITPALRLNIHVRIISCNTQQKETYQARIEEMEIESVNNNKEMKNMTHDMKTVNNSIIQ